MTITATGLFLYLATYNIGEQNRWLRNYFHGLFIILSLFLMAHLVPGFDNVKVYDKVRFSADSLPFSMYLNFDKPFVGIVIVSILGTGGSVRKINDHIRILLLNFGVCIGVLLLGAFALNYVAVDVKLPSGSWIWVFNNLLFVAFTEEAFFRRYIQGGLTQRFELVKGGPLIALLISALAFGLAHSKGGASYVVLSTIAGLFYGFAYMKTNRLEPAVLTHFLLNLVHFLLFSYPALEA
jgi:membrane protease YdiL (CAAX protease family)